MVKLNSTSIFPAIWYKGFVNMSVMDFIGINSFEGTVTEKMVQVKTVQPDQFWIKNCPAGPFLVTKSGPSWLKMVRCQKLSNNVST